MTMDTTLLLPHEIKQEDSDPDVKCEPNGVDSPVNNTVRPVRCTCKMRCSTCNTPASTLTSSPSVAASVPVQPALLRKEKKNGREVLVTFGTNRKKVFSLLNDGVSLKSKLEAHIKEEDAFAKLLKNHYIVLQMFSEKFDTWVDADESELQDGALVNALFFPRKVQGGNAGDTKKRSRDVCGDEDKIGHSKVRDREDNHRSHSEIHRRGKAKHKDSEKSSQVFSHKRHKEKGKHSERSYETCEDLEEGELPQDDDDDDDERAVEKSYTKLRKKKKTSQSMDHSPSKSVMLSPVGNPVSQFPQPLFPPQAPPLELSRLVLPPLMLQQQPQQLQEMQQQPHRKPSMLQVPVPGSQQPTLQPAAPWMLSSSPQPCMTASSSVHLPIAPSTSVSSNQVQGQGTADVRKKKAVVPQWRETTDPSVISAVQMLAANTFSSDVWNQIERICSVMNNNSAVSNIGELSHKLHWPVPVFIFKYVEGGIKGQIIVSDLCFSPNVHYATVTKAKEGAAKFSISCLMQRAKLRPRDDGGLWITNDSDESLPLDQKLHTTHEKILIHINVISGRGDVPQCPL